ncbi:hypothetical protein DL769_008637 [Monosporascus sp. CRB-8-3]|nr:hypothetical protein DL769_008637 [Monosporascus sp. CRB-8-3]
MSPPIDENRFQEAFNTFREKHLEAHLDTIRRAVLAGDAQKVIMTISMLLALTICPAILGTQEAIRQSQSKNKREEHRARRCNLVVSCVKPSIRSRDINGKLVVLKDKKLYITSEAPSYDDNASDYVGSGHPFAGYYLPYPDAQYEGLVSTISEDPPVLNWIYVDKNTYEVKYGVRAEAQENLTGPFDCTRQDRRMTLEGWEGFVAVEEFPGIWALYFDRDDNGLASKVPMGTRVLEVELTRREKKEKKPEPDPNQATTLDEMMKRHKEQTRQEERERQQFIDPNGQHPATDESAPSGRPQDQPAAADASNEDARGVQSTEANRSNGGSAKEEPPSPSTVSGNVSLWSAARKAEGAEDDVSVTAASSLLDRADAPAECEETGYKKPSAESEGIAELVVTAIGTGGRHYLCWKTPSGSYRQHCHGLPSALEGWLFPADGSTRDFETLQVILSGEDAFWASDKHGEIKSESPDPAQKLRRATTINLGAPSAEKKRWMGHITGTSAEVERKRSSTFPSVTPAPDDITRPPVKPQPKHVRSFSADKSQRLSLVPLSVRQKRMKWATRPRSHDELAAVKESHALAGAMKTRGDPGGPYESQERYSQSSRGQSMQMQASRQTTL